MKYTYAGIYYALIEKYLSNFTNKDIDTKIFTANNWNHGILFIGSNGNSLLYDNNWSNICDINYIGKQVHEDKSWLEARRIYKRRGSI